MHTLINVLAFNNDYFQGLEPDILKIMEEHRVRESLRENKPWTVREQQKKLQAFLNEFRFLGQMT